VGPIPGSLASASVVLIAVRDAQIDAAIHELIDAGIPPGAVVLHASGSTEPGALAALRERGIPAGTFHPLLPLADPARAAERLRGAWIGIDGDERARACARALASAVGAHTMEIPAGEKPRYHAAAVIASNFPAVLLALAERVLTEAGIAADAARSALRPLFLAAAENLRDRPAAEALTGPIVRGDVETVRRHLEALSSDAEALAAYRALSLPALELAREGGTAAERLGEIRTALARTPSPPSAPGR
jgi:predicted short-subunit dehydrogenase-like oxidoreductase (DUF2520 family)